MFIHHANKGFEHMETKALKHADMKTLRCYSDLPICVFNVVSKPRGLNKKYVARKFLYLLCILLDNKMIKPSDCEYESQHFSLSWLNTVVIEL